MNNRYEPDPIALLMMAVLFLFCVAMMIGIAAG